MSCIFKNLHWFASKAGSCTKPVPGFNIQILNEQNEEIKESNSLGRVCVKQPLPPSFMTTLYRND